MVRNSSRLSALLGAVCCLLFGHARAAAPDLLEVYHAAQASDPTLRSAMATLDVARQKLPEARAALMPTVALTGNYNTTQASTQFTGDPLINRDANYRNWSLQLTQPLFRVGNVIGNHQAEFIVGSAEAQFEHARQDLIVRVAQAYFSVNEAQDAIAAADAQVNAMSEQLAQITQGMKTGTKAMTDVDDTTSRLASARAQRVSAQGDLDNALADLQKITGSLYGRLSPLRENIALARPQPADIVAWIDQSRSNHPVVRAQELGLEAARLDIQRAQAEHLPTVDLVVNSTHSNTNHSLTTPEDYGTHGVQHQVGVQINVPLFAGGSVVAKVAEAEGNRNKSESDLEAARRDAASDAQHAYAGVTNGLAQVDALTIAVQSGENAVKGNRAGFRFGVRANVDVLNAEQQLYAAQRDLSKARYDVLLQGLKLKAAAGILAEDDVERVSSLMH